MQWKSKKVLATVLLSILIIFHFVILRIFKGTQYDWYVRRKTKIKEEEKLDVYYTLKDTIFNAKGTFNEDPDHGGMLLFSSGATNKCANKTLALLYYVHDRISLFSFVLSSIRQLGGLNHVALIVSIDHYDRQVVLEYAYMILLKVNSICTTVLWHFGENLSLSPYSTSTPLSKIFCNHMQRLQPF